jgi:CheY-like chemotaxis protein
MSPDPTSRASARTDRGPTVLVIDDEPDLTEMIRAALEEDGYRVLAAVDEAALEVARAQRPDLILLDLAMPGIDGVEMLERLRAEGASASIPVVAMSAAERLSAVAAVLPLDDRLPKPFDLDDLRAIVARHIPASEG